MKVRKRGKSWVVDFYDENGTRTVRTLKGAQNKQEAEQAASIIRNESFRKRYGLATAKDVPFEQFLVKTFMPYAKVNKSDNSFKSEIYICRRLLEWFKGKGLRQITPGTVERFKQEFAATPTKHGTVRAKAGVNYHLAVLSKILSLAVDGELIETNPCFKVQKLKINNRRLRVLSSDEEARLRQALADNPLVTGILTIALNTGMRRGEIFNIRWFDVDFNRMVIQIHESKTNRKRAVPINQRVEEVLRSLPKTEGYVFASPKTGDRLDNIKRTWMRALREAEIPDFHFHDLRHTAATRMADNGADAFTLCTIFGWSDVRMALRYTHATNAAVRRAVESLVTDLSPQQRTTVHEGAFKRTKD